MRSAYGTDGFSFIKRQDRPGARPWLTARLTWRLARLCVGWSVSTRRRVGPRSGVRRRDRDRADRESVTVSDESVRSRRTRDTRQSTHDRHSRAAQRESFCVCVCVCVCACVCVLPTPPNLLGSRTERAACGRAPPTRDGAGSTAQPRPRPGPVAPVSQRRTAHATRVQTRARTAFGTRFKIHLNQRKRNYSIQVYLSLPLIYCTHVGIWGGESESGHTSAVKAAHRTRPL